MVSRENIYIMEEGKVSVGDRDVGKRNIIITITLIVNAMGKALLNSDYRINILNYHNLWRELPLCPFA